MTIQLGRRVAVVMTIPRGRRVSEQMFAMSETVRVLRLEALWSDNWIGFSMSSNAKRTGDEMMTDDAMMTGDEMMSEGVRDSIEKAQSG